MANIARLTTPAFTYKPSAVTVSAIAKIYLVLKQDGEAKVTKTLAEATVNEDSFTWLLTQEETQSFTPKKALTAQIDYIASGGTRYTTATKTYSITDSAINEVI